MDIIRLFEYSSISGVYLPYCQHIIGVDPHACCEFRSHYRHCKREDSFRLHICVHETRVAIESLSSTKIPFLDCLQILSKAVWMPFPFCVSCVSIHDRNRRCWVRQVFHYIFKNKFSKHTFLSHLTWRLLRVCSQTTSPVCSKFQLKKGFEMYQEREQSKHKV